MIIVDEKNRECADKFSDYDYKYKVQLTYQRKKIAIGLVSLSLSGVLPVSVMANDLPESVLVSDQTKYGAAAYLLNGSGEDTTLQNGTINAKTAGVVTINGGSATLQGSAINVSNTEAASYSLSDSQFPSDYPQSDFYWRYRPFGYSSTADYSAGTLATPSLSGDLQSGVSAFTFTAYRQPGFAAGIFAADGSTQNISGSVLNVYSENGIALGVVADKVDYSSGAGGGTVNLSGTNNITVKSDGTHTGDADNSETFSAVALKTNAKWNIPAGGYGTINVSGDLIVNTNGAVAVSRGGYISFTNATVTSDSNTQPLYFQTIGGGGITFNGTTGGNNQWEFVGGGIGGASGSLFDLSGLTTGSLTVGNLTGVSPDGIPGGALYDKDGNATGKYAAGDATINLGANNLLVGGANKDGAWSGIIEGNGGSLTKTGTGSLTLSGTNTYNGGTWVDGGSLILGSDKAILTNTALTINSGELDLGNRDFTASQFSGNGGSVNLNAQNLTVDQATDTSYAGSISGTGSLTKQGTGALVLSGDSNYSGGTTLSAGEIDVGSNTALGSGDLSMAADTTLGFSDTGVNLANTIVLSGPGTTINTGSYTGTLSGVVSGDTSLNKQGSGTLVLAGNNIYSGGTQLTEGKIDVGSSQALGTGMLTMANSTTLGFAANNLSLANNVALTGDSAAVNTASNSETLSGTLSGEGELHKTGSGTLTLSGDNTYGGGTLISAGRVNAASSTALGSGTLSMADGTTLGFVTDNLTLANDIAFTGDQDPTIDTGAYTSTLAGNISGAADLTKTGSGTLITTGDNNTYSGATTVAKGTLQAGSAGTFSSASAYTVDSGATLDLNSYSQTISALNNSGLVSLSNSGSAGTTLTVNGDYSGNNGTLLLNTVLGGDDSLTDKLIVTGAASGSTNVVVNNNNGSGAQTLEGIEVIKTGSSTTDAFVQSGRIVAGAYDYHLQQGNASGADTNDWYLTSSTTGGNTGPDTGGNTGSEDHTYRPEAASYTANLAAANNMFSTTLHDRLGETRYTDALTGEKKVTSMWMRNLGSHHKFSMSDGQNKTSANRYVLQIGGDIAQWSASGQDRFHVGVMGGYGNQHSNSHNSLTGYDSRGDIHGYSAGLYGTWYQNDTGNTGLYVDSWALYNWFDNDVQGQGLASESYRSKGFTASVESGYTFHAGSYKSAYGMTSDFYIQPQVQLTWLGVKANDHTESNGTLVQGVGNDNLQARVGTRFYLKGKSVLDKNTRREFEPFIETNWIYNTRQYGTRMNGISDDSQGSRNIGEVKAGVEAKINNRMNLWTTVSRQVGGHGYSNTQGAVGLKYMF